MSPDKVNKIFVISLERRKDRWFEFYRKSKEAYITEYEKWDASDGQSIKLDDEVRFLFRNDTYKIKRGVIGCAMSHYKLWKHCYENNIDKFNVINNDNSKQINEILKSSTCFLDNKIPILKKLKFELEEEINSKKLEATESAINQFSDIKKKLELINRLKD